jgi:hypothetical protein
LRERKALPCRGDHSKACPFCALRDQRQDALAYNLAGYENARDEHELDDACDDENGGRIAVVACGPSGPEGEGNGRDERLVGERSLIREGANKLVVCAEYRCYGILVLRERELVAGAESLLGLRMAFDLFDAARSPCPMPKGVEDGRD